MKLKGVSRFGFLSLLVGLDKRQATLQTCIRAEGEQKSSLPLFSGIKVMYMLIRELSTMKVLMSIFKAVHGWTVT